MDYSPSDLSRHTLGIAWVKYVVPLTSHFNSANQGFNYFKTFLLQHKVQQINYEAALKDHPWPQSFQSNITTHKCEKLSM